MIYDLRFKIFLAILVTFLFLNPKSIFLNPVSAHLMGQPPFFKINNQYSNLYPVPVSSLSDFDLPQDIAPENYLVNQKLDFELDETKLPAPPDIVEKTKYSWDFGDGTTASGLRNYHTYSKMGSYIIKINADDGTTPKPQLLESAFINILPQKDYQLPQAIIAVNRQQSKDPLTDILQFDFKDNLNFNASLSKSSSDVTEYFWDFGDQKSDLGAKKQHQYPQDLSQTFVVLRIKTKDGFVADNFVEIQNQAQSFLAKPLSNPNPTTVTPSNLQSKPNQLPWTLAGIAILLGLIIVIRKFLLKKK